MFLSRCEINPRRREARSLLGSPQALHAAVRYAFPSGGNASDPGAGRVLWRLDSDGHRHMLYTVSPMPPDFTHIVEAAGWPSTTQWETRDYSPLLNRLSEGQSWGFRLTANPARSGRPKDGAPTQRFGHVTVTQQEDWLQTRSAKWGFKVSVDQNDSLKALVTQRTTRTFRRGDGRVTVSVATFEGELQVVDSRLLRESLITGMGHAKAYGCGLMTLVPLAAP